MRVLVQRVERAEVRVDGTVTGSIGRGLLVLLGVGKADVASDGEHLARKVANLRVFPDEEGRMSRDCLDAGGAVLVVSQFTLYGNCRKGNRPSFDDAAPPDLARELYEKFVEALRSHGLRTETGQFQAMMQVELVNDGPVTIWLQSKDDGRTE